MHKQLSDRQSLIALVIVLSLIAGPLALWATRATLSDVLTPVEVSLYRQGACEGWEYTWIYSPSMSRVAKAKWEAAYYKEYGAVLNKALDHGFKPTIHDCEDKQ